MSLSKELETIKSYLEIEKARFGDKLNIVYDIAEDIDCFLPPLLLQPIVENAVKHGVFEKVEKGTVEIMARDYDDKTELIVRDDGVGIDEKVLNSLLDGDDSSGIGLKNVNHRLKTKYGEEYGLTIDSKLGHGTTVKMIIPKESRRIVV